MYSAAGRAVRLSLDCQRALEANKLNLAVSHLFAPQPAYSAEARRQTEKRQTGQSGVRWEGSIAASHCGIPFFILPTDRQLLKHATAAVFYNSSSSGCIDTLLPTSNNKSVGEKQTMIVK
ncbi:unnamed protein product [Onchocerca ochengi]|uniref:Uncharacterized protein n=1 Tax=Onchocerca ochengi TaxID=42157 RepID=A0A182EE18_ONCOC|nr:unnamed protein product [Onchocerca ochengi]